jgi:site-specific recombinase XerD
MSTIQKLSNKNGVSYRVLIRLGHKQIQMTKRYAHLCIDHKQRLINKVLGGITET